ncbi:MAG: hypothetical protein DRZ90_12960 [Spirochaetes bacterium]|nr:MAG: hypothetical protein DRZ90_12960 [Spirochaetota bacterium]
MNNVFSIFRTQLFKKWFPQEEIAPEPPLTLKMISEHSSTPWIIRGGTLGVFILEMALLNSFDFVARGLIFVVTPIGGLFTGIFGIIWIIRIRKKETSWRPFLNLTVLWTVYLYLVYDGATKGFLDTTFSNRPLHSLMFLLQVIIGGYSLHFSLVKSDFPVHRRIEPASKTQNTVLILSGAFLSVFFLFLAPLMTFAVSPSELSTSLPDFITSTLITFLLALIAGSVLYLLFRKRRQSLGRILLFLTISSVIYYYLLPTDFGLLDANVLMKEGNFDSLSPGFYVLDFLVLTVLWWISGILFRIRSNTVVAGLAILLLGVTVEFTVSLAGGKTDSSMNTAAGESLPAESDRVHSFSRTEKNVILFIPDMFNGGYLQSIKEERPDIIEKLTGFTWYPDTTAVSSYTITSMPALLAGNNYTPEGMNNQPGSNWAKLSAVYDEALVPLVEKGWNVSLTDPFWKVSSEQKEKLNVTHSKLYYPYWSFLNGIDTSHLIEAEDSTVLTMLGVLSSAPYFLKRAVYSDGNWVVIPNTDILASAALTVEKLYAYLDLLPVISRTDSEKPTFKYIHSKMTHHPHAIDADGNIRFDAYPDPLIKSSIQGRGAYFAAKEFLILLTNFTDWLKSEEIYNNTMIVVVADHGNREGDDPTTPEDIESVMGQKVVYSRMHPLLMVKEFADNSDFNEDLQLMSNGDVMELISQAIDLKEAGYYEIDRPLSYSNIKTDHKMFSNRSSVDYQVWQVEDSIFETENWKVLKE